MSVFDKLLIGIVVAIVASHVQSNQRREDQVAQERIAVGRGVTEVLANQRDRLMTSFSGFVGLVNELIAVGSARGDDDATRLERFQREMRGAVEVLKAINLARQTATCKPSESAVLDDFAAVIEGDLALPLLTRTMTPTEMQGALDDLLVAYTRVLEFTSCLAIDTIQREVARVQ